MSIKMVAYVPDSLHEAATKMAEHYGEDKVKMFYALDGSVLVEYHDGENAGVGVVRFAIVDQRDTWVVATHLTPTLFEGGLPDRFNANVMYDTTKAWWPETS